MVAELLVAVALIASGAAQFRGAGWRVWNRVGLPPLVPKDPPEQPPGWWAREYRTGGAIAVAWGIALLVSALWH